MKSSVMLPFLPMFFPVKFKFNFEDFRSLLIWNLAKVGMRSIKIHFRFMTNSFIKQMPKEVLSKYVNDSSYKGSNKNYFIYFNHSV